MKTFRLTWYDKNGKIHKVVLEGEETSIDILVSHVYKDMVSLKELEEWDVKQWNWMIIN